MSIENPLYECKIIVPAPNAGELYPYQNTIHKELRGKLIDAWGGVTGTLANLGAWRSPTTGLVVEEPVYIYTIATPATKEDTAKLIEIAAWVGFELNQEEVYVATWSGRVEFVKPLDWSK